MKKEFNAIEDLIYNPSFIHWVYQSDQTAIQYWNEWLAQHPEKKELVADAVMLVKGITFRRQPLPQAEIAASWKGLQEKINQKSSGQPAWHWERRYQMAAAVALLLASAILFYFFSLERTISYTTHFGEIQNILLPDSSRITLNANSTLSYKPSSMGGPERKVYLEGEAFFRVVKKTGALSSRFLVITENAEVEVLGTQFNVNSRHGKTSVVLNTGKVKFNVSEGEGQNTLLEPGDRVEYSTEQQELTREKVNPEIYSSWRTRMLKFDDTSLLELTQILEDNYGLKVVIENKRLQQKKITGEISAKNIDTILKAVSLLFRIKVRQEGDIIYFS